MGQAASGTRDAAGGVEEDDEGEGRASVVRHQGEVGRQNLFRSRSALSLRSVTSVASAIRNCYRRVRDFISPSSRRLTNQRIYTTEYPKDQLVSNMAVKLDDDFHLEAALEAQTLEDVENDDSNNLTSEDLELEKRFEEKRKKVLEDIQSDPYMDFPILRDVETMNWLSRNYVMLIMRGLPGSGKSTLVENIVSLYTIINAEEPEVCSADHYFLDSEGNYHFNPNELQQAHKSCQDHALRAVEEGKKMIIIDNTNVVRWEMAHYFQLAEKFPHKIYRIILCEPQTPWALDPNTLALKNSHGVAENVLRKKVIDFGVIKPSYYAWFLDRADSCRLLKESLEILQKCFQVREFWEDFKKYSSMVNIRSALTYYNRDMCLTGNRDVVHCTAKFCGYDKSAFRKSKSSPHEKGKDKKSGNSKSAGGDVKNDSDDYAAKKVVQKSLGICQKLTLIGFIFSKETFGARVQLTPNQLELYDQEESNSERNVANRQYGKPAASTSKADGDTSTQDKSSLFIVEKTDSDLRDEKERFYPIPGIGKRAHITLGTSEGVRPVKTGIDVLEAVQYEKEASEGNVTPATYSLPDSKSQLRCYKSGLWVLYPETHLVFDSLFTGHY